MAKFIVLGADGQLGRAMTQLLGERGETFVAPGIDEADLSVPDQLNVPLSEGDVLINCAAYTNVDGAELDEATATRVNAEAVKVLAESCRSAGALIVHFSTDYVFDGQGSQPLTVEHPRDPLNAYGRSKAKGEEFLERSGAEMLLIRTSWVYASWGNNFVLTMRRLMAEKTELRVVDDQRGRPTHVLGLAERTLGLVDRKERGVFHITDGGECTWFGLAQEVAKALGTSCRVLPCSTEEFPRPATRPAYGVLDLQKADAILGPARPYQQWVKQCLSDIQPD